IGSLEDVKGGLPGTIYHLAYGGSVLYASTSMPLIPSYPLFYLNGIYRYDPASGSWSMLIFSLSYKFPVPYIMKCGGPYLYMYGLATGSGYIAWRYDPGTGLWTDTDPAGNLKNVTVTSLEWDGSYLYAGAEYNGVWRYSPLIGAWSNTGGGIKGVSVYSMAWSGSRLFALGSGSGIWSYDPMWSVWTNLGGARGSYEKYPLACDGPNLYAGSDGMGIWRFRYSDAPVVASLIPSAGSPGTEVIVCGSGFGSSRGSSSVSFGTAKATEYLSWNETRIRCRVPDAAAGETEVRVSTEAGTSNGVAFNVTAPGVWVFSVSPENALEGSRSVNLVVEGSGFRPGAEVRLEQAGTGTVIEAGAESVFSGSMMACTLDLAGAPLGDYDVVVRNPDAQEGRLEKGFRITNLCGQGGGTATLMLGLAFGLLSLAGSTRRRRRRM
uniref:IPT/TIG domain-containing protein n=1 Tax=Candidatus Solincola tengchongensis TaxID=2900693 RepID=UPI00257A43B3